MRVVGGGGGVVELMLLTYNLAHSIEHEPAEGVLTLAVSAVFIVR